MRARKRREGRERALAGRMPRKVREWIPHAKRRPIDDLCVQSRLSGTRLKTPQIHRGSATDNL